MKHPVCVSGRDGRSDSLAYGTSQLGVGMLLHGVKELLVGELAIH